MVLSAGDAYGEQWGTRKEELERDIAEEEERIVRMRRAVDPQDAALASGEPVQGWFRQRMSSVFKTVSSKSKSQAAPAAHVEGEWTHGRPTPSGSGGTHATDASPSAVRAVASWLVGAAAPRPVAAPLPEVVAPPGIVSPPVWEDERTASATNVVGRTAPPPPVAASPENTEEHEDTLTTAPPARRRSTLPVEEHLASRAPSFARASAAPAPRASSASAAPVADAQLATAGRAPRASASAAPGVDAAPAPLSSPAAVVAAVPSVRQNIAVGVDAQQAVAAPAPRAPSPPVPAPPRQRPPAEQPRQAVYVGAAPRVEHAYAEQAAGEQRAAGGRGGGGGGRGGGGVAQGGAGAGGGKQEREQEREEPRVAAGGALVTGGASQLWMVACDSKVCIRESPSLFGKEIGTIEPGEYVEVVDSKFSWNSRWLKLRFWVDFSTFPLRSFRWSKEAWVCQTVGGKELLGRADAYPGGIDPPISSSSDSGRALPAARWVVAAPGGVEVQTGAAATAAVASSRSFREVLLVSHQENGWVKLAARGSSGALGRHLGGEEWVRVRGGGQGGRAERVLPLVEAQKVVEDWVVTWPGGITVRATPSFSAPRVGGIMPGSVVPVVGVHPGKDGVPWLLLSGWRAPGEGGGWREGAAGEAWVAAEGAQGDTLLRRKAHNALGALVKERWKVVASRGVETRGAPEDRQPAVGRLDFGAEVDMAEIRGVWARLRATPDVAGSSPPPRSAESKLPTGSAGSGGEQWVRTVGPGDAPLLVRIGKRLSSRETAQVEAEMAQTLHREKAAAPLPAVDGTRTAAGGLVPGAVEGAAGAWKVVAVGGAKMRDAPDGGARVVGVLEAWRVVAAEEEVRGWLRIADPSGGAGGASGWWVWVKIRDGSTSDASSMLRLGKVLG